VLASMQSIQTVKLCSIIVQKISSPGDSVMVFVILTNITQLNVDTMEVIVHVKMKEEIKMWRA